MRRNGRKINLVKKDTSSKIKVNFRGRACRIVLSVPLWGCGLEGAWKLTYRMDSGCLVQLTGWELTCWYLEPRASKGRSLSLSRLSGWTLVGQIMHMASLVEKNLILGRENVRRRGKSGSVLRGSLDSGGRLDVCGSCLCYFRVDLGRLLSFHSVCTSAKGTILDYFIIFQWEWRQCS